MRTTLCAIVVACMALALSLPSHAASFLAVAGRSVPGPAAGNDLTAATVAFLGAVGSGSDVGPLRWAPIATVGWMGSHHTDRGHLNRSVFLGAAGARIGFRRLFLSEQLTATSIRTSALSSRFEFMTTLGLQLGPVMLMARHISNGQLIGPGPNHGETMLLVGVAF